MSSCMYHKTLNPYLTYDYNTGLLIPIPNAGVNLYLKISTDGAIGHKSKFMLPKRANLGNTCQPFMQL